MREFGMPFLLAIALTHHAEWLVSEGRTTDAEPLLAEARETFEELGAKPWLERIANLTGPLDVPTLQRQ
jgi:hypothetical protein